VGAQHAQEACAAKGFGRRQRRPPRCPLGSCARSCYGIAVAAQAALERGVDRCLLSASATATATAVAAIREKEAARPTLAARWGQRLERRVRKDVGPVCRLMCQHAAAAAAAAAAATAAAATATATGVGAAAVIETYAPARARRRPRRLRLLLSEEGLHGRVRGKVLVFVPKIRVEKHLEVRPCRPNQRTQNTHAGEGGQPTNPSTKAEWLNHSRLGAPGVSGCLPALSVERRLLLLLLLLLGR